MTPLLDNNYALQWEVHSAKHALLRKTRPEFSHCNKADGAKQLMVRLIFFRHFWSCNWPLWDLWPLCPNAKFCVPFKMIKEHSKERERRSRNIMQGKRETESLMPVYLLSLSWCRSKGWHLKWEGSNEEVGEWCMNKREGPNCMGRGREGTI